MDQARERLEQAESAFTEAELEFNVAAAESANVWTHNLEGLVKKVHGIVSQIREGPSLDHTGTKREILKELDELRRRLPTLRDKIKSLGE